MSIEFDDISDDEPVVNVPKTFDELMLEKPQDIAAVGTNLKQIKLRRGHKIKGTSGQIMNLFAPDVCFCRSSIFEGFKEGQHKIFFYESDTDIEEYGNRKEFFLEKLGLLNFPLKYHTNECSSLRKLADSIKPIDYNPRGEKAQRFLELINKDCPLEIDVFVSRIWEDRSPYCEFLGHYQLYCIESLAHGAFAFRRTSKEGHFTKK